MKDFWAEELQNQRKSKVRKIILLVIILIIILAILATIVVYLVNSECRKWCDENVIKKEIQQDDAKYIDIDMDDNVEVYAYDKYICVFRKKTLEFYNRVGSKVTTIEMDINKPVFSNGGRYLAIHEDGGQKFCLISGKEKLFEDDIDGNIKQINISKNGYVSVVFSNASNKSIVDVYNNSGTEMFKINLTSRVVDVSMSQDSKYLAIAEVDLSGIIIQSRIKVVSMELAQTDPANAIQYTYEAETDKLIMNIEYQEQNNLLCMYNDSIDILHEKDNKQIESFIKKKMSFMTVNLNNRAMLLEEISTGEYTADTRVRIVNPLTLKEKQYVINGVAKSIVTSENRIAVNLGTELHIIDKNGILLQKYISKSEINDVVMTDGLVGVVYRNKICIINL